MVEVQVKEKESFELALRRFKKMRERAGVLREIRSRALYEKPSDKGPGRNIENLIKTVPINIQKSGPKIPSTEFSVRLSILDLKRCSNEAVLTSLLTIL